MINTDASPLLNGIIFSINYYTEVYIYLHKIYNYISFDFALELVNKKT